MGTLEDRICGEKLEYYCSSSEEEDENPSNTTELENAVECVKYSPDEAHGSSNTGPKGVMRDWECFKEIQRQNLILKERNLFEMAKKAAFTTTPANKEETDAQEAIDQELEELMSEDFLREFQKIRIAEILKKSSKQFGQVFLLSTPAEFLDCIDSESPNVPIIIHIYDTGCKACRTINTYLDALANKFVTLKFAKVAWSITGMTRKFKNDGLPALLIYEGCELKSSFIKITEELSDDFTLSDFENFLIEKGIIVEVHNRCN